LNILSDLAERDVALKIRDADGKEWEKLKRTGAWK